ncbi:hypothetical protein STEG23_012850, partial [Scotinomys teguina]
MKEKPACHGGAHHVVEQETKAKPLPQCRTYPGFHSEDNTFLKYTGIPMIAITSNRFGEGNGFVLLSLLRKHERKGSPASYIILTTAEKADDWDKHPSTIGNPIKASVCAMHHISHSM